MPINASYEFFDAEKEYLDAQTLEDKIYWLEEMIRRAPKHKSSENFVAELKRRLIKFKEKEEKGRKSSGGKRGIRKEGFQFVLVGLPNGGKSSVLARITNASPKISEHGFSTTTPEIGTFYYEGVKAQVIDLPPIGSENFDIGIINTADCIIEVVESVEEIKEIDKHLTRVIGKKIIVLNKVDLLDREGLRKLEAKLKSKKINGIMFSALTGFNLDRLKELMFEQMDVIRVYTKEPGKVKGKEPIVLKKGATVRDAAEEILKGFSARIKDTRITGPSSKFPNQRVSLNHVLRDLDVVEFHTR